MVGLHLPGQRRAAVHVRQLRLGPLRVSAASYAEVGEHVSRRANDCSYRAVLSLSADFKAVALLRMHMWLFPTQYAVAVELNLRVALQ